MIQSPKKMKKRMIVKALFDIIIIRLSTTASRQECLFPNAFC